MKSIITVFILIGCCAAASGALPYRYHPAPLSPPVVDADSSHNWDALHYEVTLQVTPLAVPDSLFIDGGISIRFTPEIIGLDTVDLHFHGLEIASVELDGVSCSFDRVGDMLYVALPEPHNPGEELYLDIIYSGVPEITGTLLGGVGIHYPSTTMIHTQADPFGAQNWMPCWDEPWDKATLRQRLIFPSDFIVVANGTFEDSTSLGGWTQWTYFMNYPIATYLISFCASNYVTFEDSAGSVAIKHFVYPQHLAAAQYDFGRVPEMIEAFSGFYGPYPFDTFGNAEAPVFGSGGGAMENQTMVTFGNLLITGNRYYEDIVAHELAHQWFGDAVSYIDWPEMWLSEGFAVYSEALWHQHLEGMPGYFQNMTATQQVYYNWENVNNPLPIYDPPWEIIWSPLTYEKPASVLHMLRYHIGDEDFFNVLQSYQSQFQHGNASTGDVAAVVQQVTGQDYDWYFDQWIYQPGYPIFEYFADWEPLGDDYSLTLSVAQMQNDNMPRFRTDGDLYVFSGIDTVIERVTIEALYTQEIELTVTDEPDSIQLDPRSWILGRKYRRDDLTAPELAADDPIIADEGGDGFLDPGEQGDLSFVLSNSGLPTDSLVVELTSMDAQLYVVEGTRGVPALPFNGQYDLSADPFVVENDPLSGPRWVEFRIQVVEVGGSPIATLWIDLPVGTPELLLVDDDGGGSAEADHQEALNNIGRVYRTVEYTSPLELPPLEDYLAVIWACGLEMANTLTLDDQALLQAYLETNGGGLFLSGRGVVPDLAGTAFFENVLHARDVGTTNMIVLNGVDPLVQGLSFSIYGDGSNQDIIEPDDDPGSDQLLTYYTGQGAAVKFDGAYKSCLLGFGFEDFQSGNPVFADPEDLLGPVVAWFTGTPGVQGDERPPLPQAYSLGQNYPNPFNAETVIPLELPQRSMVRIELFDVAGRNLGIIHEGIKEAGWLKIRYNASKHASGVYFYRITYEGLERGGKFNDVGKMLLLK